MVAISLIYTVAVVLSGSNIITLYGTSSTLW